MSQATEKTILRRIYGKGRGWAFSQKDLTDFGSRSALDVALHRLCAQGTIRRDLRGIYDYPRHSALLGEPLSPDIDQVAHALARKFGWRILPNGPSALNLMGLSTQVPAQYLYLSDGPDRSYRVGSTDLAFKQTALKEARFVLRESSVIVQGLKSLGQEALTVEIIAKIRDWLPPALRPKVLTDTRTATGWVYEVIRRICGVGENARGSLPPEN
jgi:hypothetical protein